MSTDDTAASEHGADAETTEVPPPAADEPDLAWSHYSDTDEEPTNRHGRLMWAGLSVLVVAVTAALILLVSTLFSRHQANLPHSQPIPSPLPTHAAAAPPPPTVTAPPPATVTVTPPTTAPPTPTPVFSGALDERLLNTLAGQYYYTITDSTLVIQNAHRYCVLVQQQGIPVAQARQTVGSGALSAHPVGNQIGMDPTIPFTCNASDSVENDWKVLTAGWAATHRTLACGRDNRLVEKGWTTRKNAHCDTEWIPPPHLDYGQPRVNSHHHPEKLMTPDDEDDDGGDAAW